MMINSTDLLQTRLAILTLSQAAGWITTIGHGETETLAYVLPRTAAVASVRLSCALACHKHDEAVGAGHYHLFRLTSPLEEQLNKTLLTAQKWFLTHTTPTTVVPYLTQLTEGIAIDAQPGPSRMGPYSDLVNSLENTIACLAKHYMLAYQQGYQTFPYFS